MAEKNGRLYICDKCGKTEFCECTGEKERDGGFTRWNTFEPLSEGWGYAHDCKKMKRLCPKCNAEYQSLVAELEEKIRGFENG